MELKKTKTKELTQARLKEVLHYDPETGFFTWKVQTGSRGNIGRVAGSIHRTGYRVIKLDKKIYSAHRLAFLYMEGEFPVEGLQVDHINHNRADNRWDNLRIVTQLDNTRNASLGKNNSSGCVGVCWHKRDKVWISQIKIHGKRKHLGNFKDKTEAIKARKDAERKYGYHPNHGKGKSKY